MMNTIGYFVYLFLEMYMRVRFYRGRESKESLKNRFAKPTQTSLSEKPIWIHGASVGESLSAIVIVNRLKELNPNIPILFTTTTLAGGEVIKKRLGDACVHQFAPLDCPHLVRRFINYWQPRGLLLIESEIWPNILSAMNTLKRPVYLINARCSQHSQKRWKFSKLYAKSVFSKFTAATAPTLELKKFLEEVGVRKVLQLPHLKYAAPQLPYSDGALGKYKTLVDGRPSWVAASIHGSEEAYVIKAHEEIITEIHDVLTIFVPRHLQRIPEIINSLDQKGITWALHSKVTSLEGVQVLIVDTMGELGLFYALSSISFVGGSLVSGIGGHNPIEPANFENAVIWGPFMENCMDLCEDLKEGGLGLGAPEELSKAVLDLLHDPRQITVKGQLIYSEVKSRRSSVDDIIQIIDPIFASTSV
jgi:3-deoxy-D-manno-octulosonic-acid transferase